MTADYDIIYSPEAVDDLRSIYAYISEELLAPQAAENTINRIRDDIRRLDRFPEKHRVVDWEPWHSMEMRIMPVKNFEVYYLVGRDSCTVSIVRIFYGGRDVEHIIQEESQ